MFKKAGACAAITAATFALQDSASASETNAVYQPGEHGNQSQVFGDLRGVLLAKDDDRKRFRDWDDDKDDWDRDWGWRRWERRWGQDWDGRCRDMDANVRVWRDDDKDHGDRFVVRGWLSSGGKDLDLEDEDVKLLIGDEEFKIPSGAFKDRDNRSTFVGSVDGVDLRIMVEKEDGPLRFRIRGQDADLDDVDNPIRVRLNVGDDRWCTRTYARIHSGDFNDWDKDWTRDDDD